MKLFFRHMGQGNPVIILHGLLGLSDNWVTFGRQLADDFVLVDENEIRAAIKLYVEKAHTIAEGAGAASLAAAVKLRDQLKGKKVGLILSGGNITADNLRDVMNQHY